MGREVRRVPAGFDWPLNKVWQGFIQPEWLNSLPCPDCVSGYSIEAQRMSDEWYGNAPFDPASTGSERLTPTTPAVWAFAERNVNSAPQFYGTGDDAIRREAERLATLWNAAWSHHLSQDDVDALVDDDRLWDFTRTWTREDGWQLKEPPYRPTAAEVNTWSLSGFGHDAINQWVCVRARAEREGVDVTCGTCRGRGGIEAFKGQRKLAKRWKRINPPKGDWWQVWETVSEGSPVTPAFATPEDLARHLGGENTLEWITGPGWAPSGIVTKRGVQSSDQIIKNGTQ